MKKRLVLTLAAAGLAAASSARAQALLAFSGGNGTPLTLTLNAPISYTVTRAGATLNAPYFDFQGVGNVFSSRYNLGGTITFTINAGAAQGFGTLASGFSAGSEAATDAYLYGSMPGVAVGNTVTLNAGTLTTTGNFAGAPPAGGSFQTFLFDGNGNKLDAVNGVAGPVPEPSTWALLGVGAGALGFDLRRRRVAHA